MRRQRIGRSHQPFRQFQCQLIEMRDDRRWLELAHMPFRITEIDGDDGDAGRLGGVDVGLRIAHHEGAPGIAAGQLDRLHEMARVGLAVGKRILSANGGEAVVETQAGEKALRKPFQLVGANREAIAGVGEAVGRSVRSSMIVTAFVALMIMLSVYGQSGNFNLSG